MNQFNISLWGDEGWAAAIAVKPLWQIVTIVSRDTSPPLYYLLLHLWIKVFGTSEIAIRSLSFLFFLLTALTVYLIGKHWWNKKTGLIAALLVALNPFLFSYAFEGRMYALLGLTTSLSIYFFLKKSILGFILATTAAMYTHHFAIFIVFWEFLWTIKKSYGEKWQNLTKSLIPFVIIGSLYLPWLYPLYYQTSLVGSGFWLGKPVLLDLLGTTIKFLVGTQKNIYANIAFAALIVGFLLRRWNQQFNKTLFLTGWFFSPLVLTFLISQKFQSIFYDRYLLIVIPAAAIIVASQRRQLSFVFLTIVILLTAVLDYNYFTHPTKKPFREYANYIKQKAVGIPLINYNGRAHHLWESKYYGLDAPIYAPKPLPFYTGTALMSSEDTTQQLPDAPTIGIVGSTPPEEVTLPGYQITEEKHFDSLYFLWANKE
ncbi:MAG: glycosyltransferase family 39 protein [Candidatus Shapirobacteria bacterium]